MVSSTSSPPADASPPSPAVPTPTGQATTIPIPAALVEGVANLGQSDQNMESEVTAAYAAHSAVDSDSEASFWDIIADSHVKLESYGDHAYDQDMADSVLAFTPQTTPPSMNLTASPVPLANLATAYEEYQQSIDTSLISGAGLPSVLTNNHPSYSGFVTPNHYVTLESRQDGTPFPLSKPILREDGLLLVGTEFIAGTSTQTGEKNRIFVTNFLSTTGAAQSSHIIVEEEVRDMHWMGNQAAIVAIGKEIQLIRLGDPSAGGPPCRLQDPINTVHSDTIRELAISPTASSYVLSGGFDETVVLTDLRNQGDPQSSAVIGKFDAYDVVSSVRWSPTDSHLSWTTDSGDFQVADTRVHSPQLQLPLYSFLNVNSLGGLFSHEYLNSVSIALGFERGIIAFVDTRMPRPNSCTSLIESRLAGIGEIRRSKSNKFAVFGRGGFSTADLNGTANGLEHINLQQTSHQISSPAYKTSGRFSYERGVDLAVSDSMGIVSVYTDDTTFGQSPAFSGTGGGW